LTGEQYDISAWEKYDIITLGEHSKILLVFQTLPPSADPPDHYPIVLTRPAPYNIVRVDIIRCPGGRTDDKKRQAFTKTSQQGLW
jgi:hypothetical protein